MTSITKNITSNILIIIGILLLIGAMYLISLFKDFHFGNMLWYGSFGFGVLLMGIHLKMPAGNTKRIVLILSLAFLIFGLCTLTLLSGLTLFPFWIAVQKVQDDTCSSESLQRRDFRGAWKTGGEEIKKSPSCLLAGALESFAAILASMLTLTCYINVVNFFLYITIAL